MACCGGFKLDAGSGCCFEPTSCCPPINKPINGKHHNKHCPIHGKNKKEKYIPIQLITDNGCPIHSKFHESSCPIHKNNVIIPIRFDKPCQSGNGKDSSCNSITGTHHKVVKLKVGDHSKNFCDADNGHKTKPVQADTIFDKVPGRQRDILTIPICYNMAFFDHPLPCSADMVKKTTEDCPRFSVNPKNFKVTNNSNNKGHENSDVDMFYLTEESDGEEDAKIIKEIKGDFVDKRSFWSSGRKIDKTCDTSGLLECGVDQRGDSIFVETMHRQTFKGNKESFKMNLDDRNVHFKTNSSNTSDKSSVKSGPITKEKENNLLQAWIKSLRISENLESRKVVNNTDHAHHQRPFHDKLTFSGGTATQQYRDKRYFFGKGITGGRAKNQNTGSFTALDEMENDQQQVPQKAITLQNNKLPTLNNSNIFQDKMTSQTQAKVSKQGSSNQPTEDESPRKSSRATSRSKKPKKVRENRNFIRRNILGVKSYRKTIGVSSHQHLDNFQNRASSKIKVRKNPVKSCPDTPTNAGSRFEDIRTWCFNLPSQNKSMECNFVDDSRLDEKTEKPEESKESKEPKETKDPEPKYPNTEKALIVNPKTGSIKSISFEIDESEKNKVLLKEDGDLHLPVISLKSGNRLSSKVSCETQPTAFTDEQIQKDIFQIKGFLYETVGADRETLYISYNNLKKLVHSYSKRLHLKKREENQSGDMTLLLRDSVDA